MTQVNIIGAGRVGHTFLRLLGRTVGDVASRNVHSAENAVQEIGHGRATVLATMRPADIWLLAVPDTEIATVAQKLSELSVPPATAVHFSGFHSADVMDRLRKKGWMLASAHPNLSFADPEAAANAFQGTFFGLEGDTGALEKIKPFLAELGAQFFHISSDQKALYHAAAVFSNNFSTVLQAIARSAWKEAGVPDDTAAALNANLLRATYDNVLRSGPQDALTGPAARGDMAVVKAQAQAVAEWNEAAGQIYDELSKIAVRLKVSGTI